MAPNSASEIRDAKVISPLDLNNIRKAIPQECFVKSPLKATLYALFDYGMVAGSFYSMYTLVHSSVWSTLSWWQQLAATLVYWGVTGFFMWCIFVVGHDCGHGTFSNSELLNDVVGHLTHGSIMVPFYPWQVSFSATPTPFLCLFFTFPHCHHHQHQHQHTVVA